MLRALGLALLLSVVCHAQSTPGEEDVLGSHLYHACQASIRIMDSPQDPNSGIDDLEDSSFCQGYFSAYTEMNFVLHSSICLGDASLGTEIRVYITYVGKNPRLMDEFPIVGVMRALKDAYPCHAPSGSTPRK
ncbi:MAG: Rap1a/Tai family immunity protein [Terriglobia bacterium]|nr:Rap1a/Tai family immunity protein [Terriglobia bacterium]